MGRPRGGRRLRKIHRRSKRAGVRARIIENDFRVKPASFTLAEISELVGKLCELKNVVLQSYNEESVTFLLPNGRQRTILFAKDPEKARADLKLILENLKK